LKREFPGENLIVAGYCHDVMCYIPSRRILQEGGYEAVENTIYYGQPGPLTESVEDEVVAAVKRVAAAVGLKARGAPSGEPLTGSSADPMLPVAGPATLLPRSGVTDSGRKRGSQAAGQAPASAARSGRSR
jgi:hypothetical protein